MNAILQIITEVPPVMLLLLKATVLLATAWSIHGLIKNRNPRWSSLLWRSTLVSLIVIAVFSLSPAMIQFQVKKPATTQDFIADYSKKPSPVPQRFGTLLLGKY